MWFTKLALLFLPLKLCVIVLLQSSYLKLPNLLCSPWPSISLNLVKLILLKSSRHLLLRFSFHTFLNLKLMGLFSSKIPIKFISITRSSLLVRINYKRFDSLISHLTFWKMKQSTRALGIFCGTDILTNLDSKQKSKYFDISH